MKTMFGRLSHASLHSISRVKHKRQQIATEVAKRGLGDEKSGKSFRRRMNFRPTRTTSKNCETNKREVSRTKLRSCRRDVGA